MTNLSPLSTSSLILTTRKEVNKIQLQQLISGAGEVTQWLKHLPQKYESWSLDPQNLFIKSRGWGMVTCLKSSTWETDRVPRPSQGSHSPTYTPVQTCISAYQTQEN